jgi:hypothetical protein
MPCDTDLSFTAHEVKESGVAYLGMQKPRDNHDSHPSIAHQASDATIEDALLLNP